MSIATAAPATVTDDTVLVRRLDTTARITNAVHDLCPGSEGGILVETLIGRYVLDRDAREVWLLVNGRRTIGEVVTALAARLGVPADQLDEVGDSVRLVLTQLTELRLLEPGTAP